MNVYRYDDARPTIKRKMEELQLSKNKGRGTNSVMKQIREINEQIEELYEKRKTLNTFMVANCTHPATHQKCYEYYYTDTLGMDGQTDYNYVCEVCCQTLLEEKGT